MLFGQARIFAEWTTGRSEKNLPNRHRVGARDAPALPHRPFSLKPGAIGGS